MNHTLFRALIALLPVSLLLSGSAILWLRERTAFLLMQLFGTGCIALVVLAHICEVLHLLPGMNWGMEHSVGHYVDLGAAVVGFTLFPAGYLLHAIFGK